ncbi:hypothetical protein LWI29_014986 [Acer saccharum]|uniref:Reverse transcriptase zinc-binding domain-containing protein n=1 Tax=Acer saccharum TaxID=4024 RepID=A0AA39SEB8_ACESA|nr:hypothetical protein LWI29_014986 [Acer saccharum]
MDSLSCSRAAVSCRSSKWWTRLWKMKIPQKVKIFIWKGCFDWIPTFYNLRRQRVQVWDICPWCNKRNETTVHALWECKVFKQARSDWLPNTVTLRVKYQSLFDLMLDCSFSMSDEELEFFCVVIWRVWYLRNSLTHGAPMADVCEVGEWAKCFLLQHKDCQPNPLQISRNSVQNPAVAPPPPPPPLQETYPNLFQYPEALEPSGQGQFNHASPGNFYGGERFVSFSSTNTSSSSESSQQQLLQQQQEFLRFSCSLGVLHQVLILKEGGESSIQVMGENSRASNLA